MPARTDERLRTHAGILRLHRILGRLRWDQMPIEVYGFPFGEVTADPPAPDAGVVTYCIDDNGSGKRELRARFPTGTPVAIATEP